MTVRLFVFASILAILLLAGCGSQTPVTYAVKVTASGIDGPVVLRNNGSDTLTVPADGAYAFAKKLPDGAAYQVEVSERPFFRNCVLSGAAGTIQGKDAEVDLACAAKAWAGAQELGDPGTAPGAWSLTAAAWPNGDAVVAWQQTQGGVYRLYARVFSGGSWGAAQKVAESSEGLGRPALATGSAGRALLVWYEKLGGQFQLRWSELAGGAWSAPASLTGPLNLAGSLVPPGLDMNASDEAVVVWPHDPGGGVRIYARRFSSGAWSSPVTVDDGTAQGIYPAVALAADGAALAAWLRVDGGQFYVSTSRFQSGAWQGEEVVSAAFGSQTLPSAALNGSGRGLVAWWQAAPGETKVYAVTYDGGWSSPELLGSDASGNASFPQAGMDDAGRGLVVWTQEQGGTRVVAYATYEAAWQTAAVLSPATGGDAERPSLALDPSGHAVALWAQATQVGDVVYAARFSQGSPDAPEVITAPGVVQAVEPQAALAATGDAVALWWQDAGNKRIFASVLR
ncbi:hypothetical protein [Oceanithermus sp.]|uniref:hypothetical protein n=1 Tax=Oceanithermus sp. TaxID=2268145 RepID=UPI00257CD003|nr:hypothetical protein [Oceanithermus sp.]